VETLVMVLAWRAPRVPVEKRWFASLPLHVGLFVTALQDVIRCRTVSLSNSSRTCHTRHRVLGNLAGLCSHRGH